MEPNSPSIVQSVDLFLREFSAFLKDAGGFTVSVIGLPNYVFGVETALFLALAILSILGLALGWVLCWYGSGWYELALPVAERFLEERLAKQAARTDAQGMAEPPPAEGVVPGPR